MVFDAVLAQFPLFTVEPGCKFPEWSECVMDKPTTSPEKPEESFAHRVLYDPFQRLHDELDRIIHDYAPKVNATFSWHGRSPGKHSVPVNLVEHDDVFELLADVPGVSLDAVDVRLSNRSLVLCYSRNALPDGEFHLHEWETGDFYRSLELPGEVDASKIVATLKDGVLRLLLPKSKNVRKREHVIKVCGE
jgi:HSP20 family protein|tara:strand:+ start:5711 stop:6283 length:573 start_codon:yes stop_codon:yes gene_type:complete